ncbi:RNA polymerase III transcription factor IIIC subunit-domain-containing protein [Lipomyces arxii]|uniref:RNA polymerase III transcription factor IIIC subunit-domain-containing protein n=1 Tax=Lipomyces arxii TaxID=56418 RepID=UPI0034CFA9FA
MDPVPRFICIEHPAAVHNAERALASLGGQENIQKTINSPADTPLQLYLHEDQFAHPVTSRSMTSSHSILLKVKVKKEHLKQNKGNLRDTLRAFPNEYAITPCAVIDTYVRFRELADFQYSTLNSAFVSKVRSSLYAGDLTAIENLTFTNAAYDMPPPPRFSLVKIPFDYSYRQNPAVRPVMDASGNVKLVNSSAPRRLYLKVARWTDASVPDELYPIDHLRPPSDSRLLQIIALLQEKFKERPIWTRRALEEDALEDDLRRMWATHVKFALQYVAFTWKSGPWRATYTKYGLDPRKDPKYSIYQTEYFRISPSEERIETGSSDRKPSHIFDGITLPSARSFQLCDITDPVLAKLVATDNFRDQADEHDGWYKSGTISKIRRIVRLKLRALGIGRPIKQMEVAKILEEASDGEMSEEMESEKVTQGTLASKQIENKEREVLEAVSTAGVDGDDKLRELLGILQQDPGIEDANDGYEIFDDEDDFVN